MSGICAAAGIFPFEGSIFPYGFHNAIPNFLRPYMLYHPKTNIPLPYFGIDWGNYPIYPLGMKALPNRFFTSLNRQMYRAIIDLDFTKIELLCDSNFDFEKEILILDSGLTPFGMAVSLNLIEVVHFFTKRGIDYELPIGPYKKTALHIAIENGHELMAKYLLNNGADINAVDSFGHDVYEKANFRGYYDFKPFLDYYKNNPITRARTDYEDYRYTREIILEDMDTLSFKPSDILEFSVRKKLNPKSQDEKLSMDKFEFYMFNLFDIKELENNYPMNLRTSYDSLYYFNNDKILI